MIHTPQALKLKEIEMKDYVILFLLILVFFRGIAFIKQAFLISDPQKYIKKLQDRIDHANKTKDKKSLLGTAILVGWIVGSALISLSIYAISTIITIGN